MPVQADAPFGNCKLGNWRFLAEREELGSNILHLETPESRPDADDLRRRSGSGETRQCAFDASAGEPHGPAGRLAKIGRDAAANNF
jgi:hypothetical protein